jgi:hypothetical protein
VRVTRREFLGCAVAAVPLRWRLDRLSPAADVTSPWTLLDLGEHCSLGESLSGYAAALGAAVLRADLPSVPRCAGLIVPAAVRIPPAASDAIATCLDDGGRVILESGAGFANEADFAAHRTVLREAFDVHVERPVDLWPQLHGSAIPYVEFTWPVPTTVRDFTRVVPVASREGEVIARVHGRPAAIKCHRGRGTLLVLGSPIGPALWAGDAEATRWLGAAVAT